ncbi:Gfo/Idh/MocA family protein [Brevibacillus daliensis]|uniref:Gfo/Idh/MocA family protein n=1 Tax=Brevibacillus daliensis TaxID=2892995 RepID=UPI001E4B105C|nr:Gfo/Idh/MocA family oxidoreductase [Brevibacillus daliensis]
MKVGVIGTGVMGKHHVRVYSSLHDRCELIGVYDADNNRAQEVASEYGIHAFTKMEELLEKVDAVSIAVPIPAHYEVGMACVTHKVHMLMEKPITETVHEARKLIEAANEANLTLQVGHIELFNPALEVLASVLQKEEIVAIDIHRMSPLEPRIHGIDVVLDSMLHDLYILQSLQKGAIKEMHAVGQMLQGAVKHATALFQFQSGVVAQITASHLTEEKIRSLRIVTRDAFVQADLLEKKIIISRATNFYLGKKSDGYSQQNILEKVIVPVQEPLRVEINHFLSVIEGIEEPFVTGEAGMAALQLATEISNQITGKMSK